MGMVLIDRGGRRVREVCRECGKVHGVRECPVVGGEERLRRIEYLRQAAYPVYPYPTTMREYRLRKELERLLEDAI
jgi:hypothetical protein